MSGALATMRPNNAISSESTAGLIAFFATFASSLSFNLAGSNPRSQAYTANALASLPLMKSKVSSLKSSAILFPQALACSSLAPASLQAFEKSVSASLVRIPSFTPMDGKAKRTWRFQHWELTRARVTPPTTAVFGAPTSSRFKHAPGKDCKM